MINKINPNIIQLFKLQFELNCTQLLLDAYSEVNDKIHLKEWNENNITVHLIGLMKSNLKRKTLQISIQREAYHDKESTYQGDTNADESVRIDIKYLTWNSSEEYEYFIEAKNLSEKNWIKSSSTKVNASRQYKRYIDTGIENFVSGRYPNGCLFGYIVEGSLPNIVNKLNELLSKRKREKEHLIKCENNIQYFYISTHPNTSKEQLSHYFLRFT